MRHLVGGPHVLVGRWCSESTRVVGVSQVAEVRGMEGEQAKSSRSGQLTLVHALRLKVVTRGLAKRSGEEVGGARGGGDDRN